MTRTRPTAPDFGDLATVAAGKAHAARTEAEAIAVRREAGNPWAEDYASYLREAMYAVMDVHDRYARLYADAAREQRGMVDGVTFVGLTG